LQDDQNLAQIKNSFSCILMKFLKTAWGQHGAGCIRDGGSSIRPLLPIMRLTRGEKSYVVDRTRFGPRAPRRSSSLAPAFCCQMLL
jgi:hypothetical protein